MNPWQRFCRWLRRDAELEEELRSHLAMAIEDRLARGESRAEAERTARRELGNELLVKDVAREVWGWTALERFGRNVAYSFRQLKRSPGFTITAVMTLGLGLSATTVMFSIINGILLEPMKFQDPDRLFLARSVAPPTANFPGDFPVNARHYYEWRTYCRSCEAVSLLQFQELTMASGGAYAAEPVKLAALGVSFNLFQTLGVRPNLGRDFLAEEDAPGRFAEVILSDALWRSRFAADPGIVGRNLQNNGEDHRVVGVMPPDLHLPKGNEWGAFFGPAAVPVIFRPLGVNASRQRPTGNLNYTSVIRLKRGVSVQQATAELNGLLAQFFTANNLQTRTILIPLQKQVTRGSRSALWMLLATVVTVLLIVCVNVGNLIVVRAAGRYREAGIRLALGATRGQVFTLALTEVMVLVAAGGLTGLALAQAGLNLFVSWAPIDLPRIEEVQIDWRVMGFSGIAMAFSTVFCGVFPAWRLSRIEANDSLKAGAATSTESARKIQFREVLVGLEVALSTILLIAGGLLLMSFFRVMRVEKGFEVAHIITQDVSYLNPKYARGVRRRSVEDSVSRLAQIPGVQTAAAINQLPLKGDDFTSELEDPDQPARKLEQQALANFRFVTPDYWQVMGIPLKMGRFLDASDKDAARAVISESAAKHLWPGGNPIGKHVTGVGQPAPTLEVVGVVGEIRAKGLEHDPTMIVYEHYWRMQPIGMSFVVRTRGDAVTVAGDIRKVFSSLDPDMAVPQTSTMEQIVEESVAARRFEMYLAVAFAISALMLASFGIYGLISFTVARRTPEIGIRVALGAQTRQLMSMILIEGLRPVLAGLIAGLFGAFLVSRLIASELFGVTASDPLTFGIVSGLLLAVAVAACMVPARRAATIDPLVALRFE